MPLIGYNARDHYWDDLSDVFSSKTQTRVPYSDPDYQAWLALGNVATKDPGEAELREVLRPYEIGLTPAETASFADDRTQLETLKAAYVAFIADLDQVICWTPPLTNAQRDGAIQGMASRLKMLLKGLKIIYQRVT